MVDFLKANPAFSMQDFMWKLSVPFIKVMMIDATQVVYLTEKQQQEYKQFKRTNTSVNKVYNDGDLDSFEDALGI